MDNLDRAMSNSGGPLTKGLERNEDLLNYNPESGLSQLAQQTGGAFIGGDNDIGSKLKEVDEDLGTYYLLTYSPTNQNYDGKFRNISVKVKKSGVRRAGPPRLLRRAADRLFADVLLRGPAAGVAERFGQTEGFSAAGRAASIFPKPGASDAPPWRSKSRPALSLSPPTTRRKFTARISASWF